MSNNNMEKEILHELYIYCEWKPEPEFSQKSEIKFPPDPRSFLHWLKLFGPERSLLECMLQWKQNLTRWQISLSIEGKLLAVLADNILEIRTKRADYSTIVARTTLVRDAHPQLRKLVWSPDCSLLAIGHSNGTVAFYDLTATNLFNIPADCLQPAGHECKDTTHALSSIVFVPPRVKNDKWSWEVLLITYNGKLRCYSVSQLDGSLLCHKFTFENGVSSVTYSYAHSLLCVAGPKVPTTNKTLTGLDHGITIWRIINDEPHYKLSVASDQLALRNPTKSLISYIPFASNNKSSYIVCMSVSQEDDKLACFDTTGEVTVWKLPALQPLYKWPLEEQYAACNIGDENEKLQLLEQFTPVDISWWDSESVIVSRANGTVSVCLLENMKNILGKKPEYLKGTPQVTNSFDKSFLAFESESTVISGNQESDANPDVTFSRELVPAKPNFYMEVTKELIKWMLYSVTDLERFQPKPKKISLVSRVYRLLCIKSTTPDELYARKIESGKYEEALALAEIYSLDKDLVYRQQWRSSPVSHRTIHQYLGKVSKKIWAVQQCVDRLPETFPPAKELLQFGLDLTDEEILNEVKSADSSVHCLDAVRAEHLNAHTSELLRCRHLMLFYLQRLQLYEDILRAEKSTYNREEYHRLRSNSLAHSAHELAKEGRIDALRCIWAQIRPVSLQLSVLENLPEVIEPVHYQDLIPFGDEKIDRDGRGDERRDWSQNEAFRSVWQGTNADEGNNKENGSGEPQPCERVAWFNKRCKDICRKSGLVSHARSLAIIGSAQGLELRKLIFDLETLETLVYDVGIEDVTLDQLENSAILQVSTIIMKKSTNDSFVDYLKEYLIPYYRRYAQFTQNEKDYFNALKEYLTQLSQDGLADILAVLKCSSEFGLDTNEHMDLAESCLMAYNGIEDIPKAYEILETVPKESSGKQTPQQLLNRMTDLEKLIWACDVLSLHKVERTIAELATKESSSLVTLTHMARNMAKRSDNPQAGDWNILLADMLELREKIFSDVDVETCYQIYATALLTSGDQGIIKLSAKYLSCSKSDSKMVPYSSSLNCVLNAAREYFNSASTLSDPYIELAKSCLNLIKEEEVEIKEELDLTAALAILNEFGLSLHPVQVRLCTERMELVKQCLDYSRLAYNSTPKLLQLATLLHICPDDENKREGQVLTAAGGAALAACASNAAFTIARRLATLRYAPASQLLCSVAALPAPATASARRQLLAAAALHTSDLTGVLSARLQLEMDEIQKHITISDDLRVTKQESLESNEEEFEDAVTTPLSESKGIFPPNFDDKFSKLSAFVTDQKWQNKLNFNWFNRDGDVSVSDKRQYPEEQTFMEEFYTTLYPECKVDNEAYNYSSFAGPDIDAPNTTSLLRSILLHYQLNGSKVKKLLTKAKDVISWCWQIDSSLATSLAVLNQRLASDANDFPCKSIPVLPQLYAALIISQVEHLKDDVFRTPPSKLLSDYFAVTKSDSLSEAEIVKKCTDRLWRRYHANRLGLKIEPDDLSERRTLEHLAREPSLESIEAAVRLSENDAGTLWLKHIEAILLEHIDSMTHAQITSRFNHESLLKVVKEETLLNKLKVDMWEKIPGCDHTALIHLFTLIQKLDPKATIMNIPVSTHLKFIKKVKATSSKLDYKLLVSGDMVLSHFLDVATTENIGTLAKLIRSVPANFNFQLQTQELYTNWLKKYLFSVPESAATSKKWMQLYRQCTSYFNKLHSENLISFLADAIFSEEAILRIPQSTRRLMLQQSIEYCQLEQENEQNLVKKDDKTWSDVADILNGWNDFLDNFHSPPMQQIIDENIHLKNTFISLEMSRGDFHQRTQNILFQLIFDNGLPPRQLEKIFNFLKLDKTLQQHIIHIAEGGIDDLTERQLERLSEVCAQCQDCSEAAQALLAKNLPPKARRVLLPLCRQKDLSASEDAAILVQHSLEIIGKEWNLQSPPLEEINAQRFLDVEFRERIFSMLVQDTAGNEAWGKRKALVDLLCIWPESEPRKSCYDLVKVLLSETHDIKENLMHLKQLLNRRRLSENDVKELLMSEESAHNSIFAIRLALISEYDSAIELIPHILKGNKSEINITEDLDQELIEELLKKGFFIRLVKTKAYSAILNYILCNNTKEQAIYNISWAVEELKRANMLAEAGQLLLLEMSVPTSLKNFTSSLFVHKRKYK